MRHLRSLVPRPQLVVACLGTVLSFDFINSVIAIALSASIISAYNATASSDVRSRARAVLNAGCTHGLAITIFVLGSCVACGCDVAAVALCV